MRVLDDSLPLMSRQLSLDKLAEISLYLQPESEFTIVLLLYFFKNFVAIYK